MSQEKIDILQRALVREKAARKQAESILEKKAIELYEANQKLEDYNHKLETLVIKKDSQLQGVFENIVDAYVVMDLLGNILKMNASAIKLLGFKNDKVDFNLMKMVLPSDYDRVSDSFLQLLNKGTLTDFEININTNTKILVHINASIIYDRGKPVAAQGIIRDVTKIKENELISEVINDITQSILGKTDIYDISFVVAKKIATYLETDDCVIYKVNHHQNEVVQIVAIGGKVTTNGNIVNKLKFSIGKGIVGSVAQTGKSELINDTSIDKRYIKDVFNNY